jgi:hypothetical protein
MGVFLRLPVVLLILQEAKAQGVTLKKAISKCELR